MEKQNNKKRFPGKIVVDIVIWILVVFVVFITISVFSSQANGGVPNFFGKMPITIQSDSMKPTFKAGDLIIDKKVSDMNSLKEGDIITFWTIIDGQRVMNTHEIVTVNSDKSFTTKGVANTDIDSRAVYPSDVVGVYTGTKIAGLGKVMDFFQTSMAFLFCVVLPLLLFFLYQVYKFIVVVISVKKPKISAEEEEEIKKKAIEEYKKAQEQSEDSQ